MSIYFGMPRLEWKPSHFPPRHDFSAVFINFLNPLNIKLHAWKFDKTIFAVGRAIRAAPISGRIVKEKREIRFRVISSLNSGFLNSLTDTLDAGLSV